MKINKGIHTSEEIIRMANDKIRKLKIIRLEDEKDILTRRLAISKNKPIEIENPIATASQNPYIKVLDDEIKACKTPFDCINDLMGVTGDNYATIEMLIDQQSIDKYVTVYCVMLGGQRRKFNARSTSAIGALSENHRLIMGNIKKMMDYIAQNNEHKPE